MTRQGTLLARLAIELLAVSLLAIAPKAAAQQLEPRSYANTPVGLNFLLAGYAYTSGDVSFDPSIPLENASLQAHLGVLAYARAIDVWGRSGKFDVVLPYARVSGSAELEGQPVERNVSGFGDPTLRFSVNFYGAPALSLDDFASYEQDLIIGASLKVSLPLGQYDDDKLVNIGTNRWAISPQIGMSKALGPLTLELEVGATFYTDNDDFLGGSTRAQDPLYSVQAHAIYNFRSGIWVALDGTYYTGGRSTIDGVPSGVELSNSRLGLTAAFPVDRYNSVKLYASSGVSARTGGNFSAVGLAWQYRWGAGL